MLRCSHQPAKRMQVAETYITSVVRQTLGADGSRHDELTSETVILLHNGVEYVATPGALEFGVLIILSVSCVNSPLD